MDYAHAHAAGAVWEDGGLQAGGGMELPPGACLLQQPVVLLLLVRHTRGVHLLLLRNLPLQHLVLQNSSRTAKSRKSCKIT